MGYNGFPRGVDDDVEDRHERPTKLMYTEHAERNAIYSAARNGVRLLGSTMYMPGGGVPCADCARALIQAGIKKFVGMDRKFEGKSSLWAESCAAGEAMLIEAGVEIVLLDENYIPAEFNYQCSRIAKKMMFDSLDKSLGEDAP
jgi:dCMP deaminase